MRRIATAMFAIIVAIALGASAASAQSALANCKYYTKVLQDFAQGLPFCEQCLKEEPDNPEARYYAGWCLAEMGKFSEAHEAFAPLLGKTNDGDKNVRENAKMAEERVSAYASAHFNQGSDLLGKGDMKGAHDEFKKAAAIDPRKVISLVSLGYTSKQLGDLDGALSAYRQALILEPKNLDANRNFSVALAAKYDSVKAAQPPDTTQVLAVRTELVQALGHVVETDTSKDAASAHAQMGQIKLELGEVEAGLTHLNKAVEIDPAYSAQLFPVLFNVGVEKLQAQQFAEASELFAKAGETIPQTDENWPDTMYNLGLSYFNAGDFAKSAEVMEKLVAVKPQKDYYNMMTLAYGKLGDQAKAAAAAKKYEELVKAEGGK